MAPTIGRKRIDSKHLNMTKTKAPTRRYPKRATKAIIKDLNVAKLVAPQRRHAKRKGSARKGSLAKKDIFPFEKLPAELRNRIYFFALANIDHGIMVPKDEWNWGRQTWWTPRPPIPSELSLNRTWHNFLSAFELPQLSLVTNLLLLNHQIHREASAILYGANTFILDTRTSLYTFFVEIGPANCAALRVLHVRFWHFDIEVPLRALSSAVNLKTLYFDRLYPYHTKLKPRQRLYSSHHDYHPYAPAKGSYPVLNMRELACSFYHCFYPWFQAVGSAKGRTDAAVDIVQFGRLERFDRLVEEYIEKYGV